ncbi:MAG: acyl-CoA dehydrogenase family protein [Sphingomonadaceae bacterium]|nr:acyl-CoA dehydrogenase family protein [Sphingomonadaceae bacterium]
MTHFTIPQEIEDYLAELDAFIEAEIKPIEQRDDNIRFFDHRREHARTDWDNDGLPREEWEELLREMRRAADDAGHFRFALPEEYGGKNGSHLAMARIREHLAERGLGLHNDLQNESSIVGNLVQPLMVRDFGTEKQKAEFIPAMLEGKMGWTFGLTEEHHGSDATWMDTRAVREDRDGEPGWLINGNKMWTTGSHKATHCMVFARHSGEDGDARGIGCFLVPYDTEGVEIGEYLWTFNMPTDHPKVALNDVWIPEDAVLGDLDLGLACAQHFVHENRIRQAASSLGAAQYCINESIAYAAERKPFGKPLSANQAIQFPLVELHTEAAMLRQLIYSVAAAMDTMPKPEIAKRLSAQISMCNYRANRLCCDAADRAMQTHGGIGYSRHRPFEHIYRHHRRYRITEGSEEIQMRKIGGHMFGYIKG